MMSISKSSQQVPTSFPVPTTYLLGFHPTSFIIILLAQSHEGWAHLSWMGPGCTNGPGPIYNPQTSSRGEGVRSFDHSWQYLFMS
jgi:hypothetical protein